MEYARRYFKEVRAIAEQIDLAVIEKMVTQIELAKAARGRMFFLGVGGSAANCTHAVNDFRKIGGMECYSPVDNVAEITARTNDEGWHTVFAPWLQCSNLSSQDIVFILSVGGGNREKNISVNLIEALDFAKSVDATVLGIIGRDGGYTASIADACVIIPTQSPDTVTPHAEAWQAVVWHMLVTDPRIMAMSNKWEAQV
jgi:D-sedoheptulose 7-phosphate isomerase